MNKNQTNYIIFLILLLSLLSAKAGEFKKPIIDIAISGFSLKEDALLSRGSSTVLSGHLKYLIDENLKINIDPVASFISGQQTSRDPQSPLTNSLYLNEASIEYKILNYLAVRGGSINQKDFLPGLAGYAKSFPAIGAIFPYNKIENQELCLKTEAAVPTSSGLATNASELESSTSLFAATFDLKSTWSKYLSSHFSISRFVFNGLSSATIADSIPKGNTLVKLSSSSYIYAYKYSGSEAKLNLNIIINPKLGLNLDTSFIKNQMAPSDLNAGYFISASIPVSLNSSYIIMPIFEHFRVESDAMVATFLDTKYGRTNRNGFRYGVELLKGDYNTQLIYAESKLIQTNPFQSADKSVFININVNNIAL